MIKKILTFIFFLSISSISIAKNSNEEINNDIQKRLYELEYKTTTIDKNQHNYKIEKDLLKETYSSNFVIINLFITLILSIGGLLAFFGLRDISSIKKEYENELRKLTSIKNEFEIKSQKLDSDKNNLDKEIKSIIKENQEQSKKIKFIELKDKARTLTKEKNYTSALEFTNAAIDIQPNDPDVLNRRGMLLYRLNQLPEAIDAFKQALLKNPESQIIKLNLVEYYYLSNNIEEAKKIIGENKILFEEKCNGKLLEFLYLIELYFNGNKDELIKIASSYVTIDNLDTKQKLINGWDLLDAQYFTYRQKDSELKTIIQHIVWYWNDGMTGRQLLNKLGVQLPTPPKID